MTGYPSIDKPWLKYYSEETINTPVPECTVYENIYQNNRNDLANIALEYFGNKITYGEMFEKVEIAKKALLANGVKKGDSVIMFTSATPELLYVLLALCRIGAVANMINPLFTHEQIRDRINETGAEIMLVLDQLYVKIQPIMDQLCIKKTVIISICNEMSTITKLVASGKLKKKIPYGENILRWKEFMNTGKCMKETADLPYEKNRALLMVYSSGTTGASKGIVLSNDGVNAVSAHYLNPDFPYHKGDKILQIIPVWFSTGIVLSVLMPLTLGIDVIMEPVFNEQNFVKGLKKHRPEMTLTSISLWIYAINSKELEKCDLSNLVYPVTGGELVLPRVEERINQFLKERNCKSVLMKGYGMCELGSTVATDSLIKQKPGATGYPMKGVTLAAFDLETNQELKYGERGEIRVNSPARMKEYFKNPAATEAFSYVDSKGISWGKTGDVGFVDEDGFVTILGRACDSFTGEDGKARYCFDIEHEIYKNEQVALCEVVGLSVGDYEVPVAHLVLEKGVVTNVEKLICQIHAACVKHLEHGYVPAGYKVCEAFPVKSGKRDMEKIKQDREGFVLPVGEEVKRVTF